MELIYHQQQPTHNTCVCTCIAMLVGKPASYIIDKYHDKFWNHDFSLRNILEDIGISYKEYSLLDNIHLQNDVGTGVLLVTAPSLNNTATFHQVLVKYNLETNEWNIFDPQAGVEGARYYTSNMSLVDDYPEQAFKLSAYMIDAFISEEEVERIQKLQKH